LRQRGAAGQHDLLAATQKTSAVNASGTLTMKEGKSS
jgi:hypothetical protein